MWQNIVTPIRRLMLLAILLPIGSKSQSIAHFTTYDTTKIILVAAMLAASAYITGKMAGWALYTYASNHYKNATEIQDQVALFEHIRAEHYGHSWLYKKLFFSRNLDSFPLVKYYNDLAWYIFMLRCLKLFSFGTHAFSDINILIDKLKSVKNNLAISKQFTHELQALNHYSIIQSIDQKLKHH